MTGLKQNSFNDILKDEDCLAVVAAVTTQQGLRLSDLQYILKIPEDRLEAAVEILRFNELLTASPPARVAPSSPRRAGLSVTKKGNEVFQEFMKKVAECFQTIFTTSKDEKFLYDDPTPLLSAHEYPYLAFILTFAVEPEIVRPLVHPFFRIETLNGKAFITVLLKCSKGLGLNWLPSFADINYYIIVFRTHIYYTNYRNEVRRGVYFLKSYLNSPLLTFLGGRLREFGPHNFELATIAMLKRESDIVITIDNAEKSVVVIDKSHEGAIDTSYFKTKQEVLDFCVLDVFHAFSVDEKERTVKILELISRYKKDPEFVHVKDYYLSFLNEKPFNESAVKLVAAVCLENVKWTWQPLKKERVLV